MAGNVAFKEANLLPLPIGVLGEAVDRWLSREAGFIALPGCTQYQSWHFCPLSLHREIELGPLRGMAPGKA